MPSRPTRMRFDESVPSSCFATNAMILAPTVSSLFAPSTKLTIRVSWETTTFFSPSLSLPERDLPSLPSTSSATVALVIVLKVEANDGKSLSVKYKDGEKKVVVSPDTPIVNFVDGAKSELTVGAKIIAFVAKKDDGTLSSKRVLVGRDGITPPM